MFIQVIEGQCSDQEELRGCMDRWDRDLKPGATGYLGSTMGFCGDGTFVCLARFESEEAARRNSARPEQGAWWAETEKCFAGPVRFLDCEDVSEFLAGGSDDARFVQIMEGHSSDVNRMRELMEQAGPQLHELRPEIIGGLMARHGDEYVEAVYFTSEAQAREHEKLEIPDDLRSLFEEETRLAGEVTYRDLHEPMLVSGAR
ncbi:hypothetical protein FXW78_45940 [Rhodococcus opacus]|nr:hypothetical protein [Rhodococcus opacus]